jgi:hypothetical protein
LRGVSRVRVGKRGSGEDGSKGRRWIGIGTSFSSSSSFDFPPTFFDVHHRSDCYFPFSRLFAQRVSEFGAGGAKPELAKGWWNLVEPIPNEVRFLLSSLPVLCSLLPPSLSHVDVPLTLFFPQFAPIILPSQRPPNFVYSPHWYDLQALFEKKLGWMSANVQGLSRVRLLCSFMRVRKAPFSASRGGKGGCSNTSEVERKLTALCLCRACSSLKRS